MVCNIPGDLTAHFPKPFFQPQFDGFKEFLAKSKKKKTLNK